MLSFGVIHFGRLTPEQKRHQDLLKLFKKVMATQAQVLADLEAVRAQLAKVGTETQSLQTNITTLNTRIAELEDLLENAEVPQAIVDKIAEVKAQAQAVDDAVPDVPTPPPPTP